MKSNLMKNTLGILALSTLGLAATGAQADWDRGNHGYGFGGHAYKQSLVFGQQINERQDRQMDRIQQGMRAGNLTRFEFHELMQEQHRIRAMEQHFRADGMIDAHEFQRMDRALDVASLNIKLEKHDRQERFAYNPLPWRN
jgi:uncharacterized membrane protein YebE (DUF533 family)